MVWRRPFGNESKAVPTRKRARQPRGAQLWVWFMKILQSGDRFQRAFFSLQRLGELHCSLPRKDAQGTRVLRGFTSDLNHRRSKLSFRVRSPCFGKLFKTDVFLLQPTPLLDLSFSAGVKQNGRILFPFHRMDRKICCPSLFSGKAVLAC